MRMPHSSLAKRRGKLSVDITCGNHVGTTKDEWFDLLRRELDYLGRETSPRVVSNHTRGISGSRGTKRRHLRNLKVP